MRLPGARKRHPRQQPGTETAPRNQGLLPAAAVQFVPGPRRFALDSAAGYVPTGTDARMMLRQAAVVTENGGVVQSADNRIDGVHEVLPPGTRSIRSPYARATRCPVLTERISLRA
eukprot:2264490-Rhodomonas_salina.1